MTQMDKIISLCKRRGFIFPSSEIYGGLNGSWDFGPLGVELKNNIKSTWWKDMVSSHDETINNKSAPSKYAMVGIDSSIIMNPLVWEASGHVGGFSDPMVDCKETKNRYRADQLIIFSIILKSNQSKVGNHYYASIGTTDSYETLELLEQHKKQIKNIIKNINNYEIKIIQEHLSENDIRENVLAPGAKEPGSLTPPRNFNLMFETHVGALKNKTTQAFLRPETAQGIFVNFKNICDTSRVKLPFGIGQIGKSFRNEINPRNFIFRSREFEQMEIEFFCRKDEANEWYIFWRNKRFEWYKELGIRKENLLLREHSSKELAHYAQGCADIEYNFPFGISELEGITNRTDYDLKKHMEKSGKDLRYLDDLEEEKDKKRFLPYVIEPSAGVDRAFLAFLCDAYTEDQVKGEKRTLLKLHPKLAPLKAAILPLVKKDGMPDYALEIYRELKNIFPVFYDEGGAIGRRYRRQDEAGTPYCITIDGESLSKDTVTLRDRDTCNQTRIHKDEIIDFIKEHI